MISWSTSKKRPGCFRARTGMHAPGTLNPPNAAHNENPRPDMLRAGFELTFLAEKEEFEPSIQVLARLLPWQRGELLLPTLGAR